jgi:hypothetical protein
MEVHSNTIEMEVTSSTTNIPGTIGEYEFVQEFMPTKVSEPFDGVIALLIFSAIVKNNIKVHVVGTNMNVKDSTLI